MNNATKGGTKLGNRVGINITPPEHILEEFPQESSYDVVVVGGGPNGLITAAYLAKAGLSVIVVERRHEIGGGLATEETLFPGFYTNPHAIYHMMVDYMPLFRDFDLAKHGLSFVKPNAQMAMVFSDSCHLLLCNQPEDTKDSIAKFSPQDARAFGKIIRKWRTLVDELIAPGTYVPPLEPIDMIEAFERTPLGREVLRLSEMSPREIIFESFENDRVRAAMLYAACMWGLNPNDTGLGFLVPLLIDRAMNKAQCYGGSHKLAGALSRVIHASGGVVLDQAEVTRIILHDGVVSGVECFDGRIINAKVVVSSLPPPLTFGTLMAGNDDVISSDGQGSTLTAGIPAALQETAHHWEWDGWSFFTLAVVTKEPPRYNTDDSWINDAFMVVMGFDSTDELLSRWNGVLAGDAYSVPLGGHSSVETRYDPTLVRIGGHAVSFLQVHVPYEIEGGWDLKKDDFGTKLLETWRRYAPNLDDDNIVMTSSETPLDIETRIATMVRGSIKHGEYNPLQMGVFRPSDTCVGGCTPIEGLYLCGASSYPGGLVIGGPGYIAANSIAEDLGIEKWWSTPDYIAHYKDTYLS
ncbi:MAG: NAD(P)/FAD-dependent oxidoreductase [Actinobacteria bacterium]|nr:NAD(P)/FAD-dependent oxidoreductase [Actinomycetota bacterium]MCL6104340.1 NAD(P)/FAD-dependent oxidoreductase [Actinomycetota bacterium]